MREHDLIVDIVDRVIPNAPELSALGWMAIEGRNEPRG
jgi:hypothetical protein